MITSTPLLLVSLFLSISVSGQSMNPCHGSAQRPSATSCTKVTLPDGFCSSCKFGLYSSTGTYVDCKKTFQIDYSNDVCMDALQTYVADNECDAPRADALALFESSGGTDENARQILDFFYYAVCESGCDCVPKLGVDRNAPVMDVHRGNCQAHAFFDICRVLPNIELIKLEGTSDVTNLPKACPLIIRWFRSQDARDWPSRASVNVHDDVKFFLERLTEATQVTTNLTFYQRCFDLENAQGRIEAVPPSDYVPPLWYDRIEEEDETGLLKRCFKRTRDGVTPNQNQKCARTPKLCYFGTQDCAGLGTHPETVCFCDGIDGTRRWNCADEPCPSL